MLFIMFSLSPHRAEDSAAICRFDNLLSKFTVIRRPRNPLKIDPPFVLLLPTENVTIDPDTAGPWLVVSEDGKELRQSPKKQKVPSGLTRFTENTFALATRGLKTGRHYWEVGVREKSNWVLGVAAGTVRRGELLTPSPEKGLWTVSHRDGRQYVVFAQKPFPVTLSPRPHTVGVFVDYEEGEVSFFDVEAETHIFTYAKCDFGGRIYPLFDPCLTREKKEAAPLKIVKVENTK